MTIGRCFFYLSILLTGLACESPVDLDIEDSEDSLVIYSLFSSDEPQFLNHLNVEVYKTKGIFEDDNPSFVEDAEVKLKIAEDVVETLDLTSLQSQFFYTINKKLEEGKFYEINVSKLGFPSVFARSYIPIGVNILDLEYHDLEKKPSIYLDQDEYNFKMTFEIEDNEETDDYYHIIAWFYRPPHPDFPLYYYTIGFDPEQELNDPDINIVNSATDFFGAYVKDDSFNGQRKQFDFDMRFLLNSNLSPKDIMIDVELRTVSEDYYRFHQEAHRLNNSGDDPFFTDPGTISNNVENGYGIFAGFSSRRTTKSLE